MTKSNPLGSHLLLAAVAAFIVLAPIAHGDGLPPDEQAFFDKHISDVVQPRPTKLADPAFLKVFATPFYAVKVVIKLGEGEESSDLVVARINDTLVSVGRPSSDADLPDFLKLLNPSFKLKTDADAKDLQTALDLAYPIIGTDDKQVESFQHTGNTWKFIRGKFFNDKLGYLFTVDDAGAIKSVKFLLKLP